MNLGVWSREVMDGTIHLVDLELHHARKKRCWIALQDLSDKVQLVNCNVHLATFDTSYVAAVNVAGQRQPILREPTGFSPCPDACTQRFCQWAHDCLNFM